jgi:hypothetical protein
MADAIDVHERLSWHEQLQALDAAIYATVAATPTPTFDRALGFTTASREPLWAVDRRRGRSRHDRRRRGRRAAASGIASLADVSDSQYRARARWTATSPGSLGAAVPVTRHVVMPGSNCIPPQPSRLPLAWARGCQSRLCRCAPSDARCALPRAYRRHRDPPLERRAPVRDAGLAVAPRARRHLHENVGFGGAKPFDGARPAPHSGPSSLASMPGSIDTVLAPSTGIRLPSARLRGAEDGVQPDRPSSAFLASRSMPCRRARFSPRILRFARSVSCG